MIVIHGSQSVGELTPKERAWKTIHCVSQQKCQMLK